MRTPPQEWFILQKLDAGVYVSDQCHISAMSELNICVLEKLKIVYNIIAYNKMSFFLDLNQPIKKKNRFSDTDSITKRLCLQKSER